ncbi:DUF6531 domain-containing protein [Amycolatopsis jiangsuensis]|uniref:RHS repeat-associated protein n=1 Tax=Amycolatopsis jiangsuensis TaxID=1181879 RepID=A0A840J7Z3_9PSEU|nr:DUF6531 domain-containing protein [Amycolatopsis jiangsuensis]MBB4689584.1 RHS repeat-associated protein [Amycolatopsis jiangsuensis]
MSNPLVAPPQDSTKLYSGITLLEDGNDLKSAIESGDWAAVAMGAVGTALDALSTAMDPFGAILSAGVGWLMEHVGPLREALDGLTGNADQITAQAETWANVAKELGSVAADLTETVKADLPSWSGAAADAYRKRTEDLSRLLAGAQKGCEGASSGVKTAGEVVGAVRSLVRDIIADLVGHLISWALQVVFTLGIGMTWVVSQVVTAVSKTASKLADLVKRLVTALKNLIPLLKRADSLFGDASTALKGLRRGRIDALSQPKSIDSPQGAPKLKDAQESGDGSGTPSPKADDTTTTSSADQTPPPASDSAVPPPKNDAGPPDGPSHASGDSSSGGTPGAGSGDKPSPKSLAGRDGPRDRALPSDAKVCVSDPVDVATGEVVMTQVDLTLPGDRSELVLSRTHLSSYREGRWFGRSWASTLDQRIEIDPEQVRFFAEDGMVLVYPLPTSGPVLPLEGPRYPLHRTPDGYRISVGSRELHFTGPGPTVSLTAMEEDGCRTDIGYSAGGLPTTIRRADGVEISIATSEGHVVALGAPGAAPLVNFGYNRLGQLTAIADFAGRPMTLDYDVDHRLVGWQDRTGTWYRYVYDDFGRCVRTVGANGFYNATFTYEPGITRHTDAMGHPWTYRINSVGQLLERVDPLGGSQRFAWSRRDQLLSKVDELGRLTRYEYENGELAAVIRCDGSVVRLVPDAEGILVKTDDTMSVASNADPFDTLPGVSMPLRVNVGPDQFGEEPVRADGIDPADRDLFGRPRLVPTMSGAAARLGWTAEGRRAWRIGPQGGRAAWIYDADGKVVEHRDAAGGVSRRAYGPFGLVTAEIDAAGARTEYTYDGELRLTSVVNPNGLTWRYAYDPVGRLIEEIDYDGRHLTYTYDAAGQLRTATNGMGESREYRYDLLGNVIERRTPTGTTAYAYDPLGRLEYAVNADSILEVVRDERGRVLAEKLNGTATTWSYRPSSVTRRTPSGLTSEWRYTDGRARSLTIAKRQIRFDYDGAGRETARTVNGKVVLAQRFDAEDRLAEQTVSGMDSRSFTYRPDGRLAAVAEGPADETRFAFDQAGRVTETNRPDCVERFGYDLAGNIVLSSHGRRLHHGNRLVRSGDTEYGYDRQGRVVGRTVGGREWRFVWDELDRLAAVVTPDEKFWTYLYDPLGRRFAKRCWVVGEDGEPRRTGETWYVWSGAELIEEIELRDDGYSRVRTWERLPDDGRPVAQIEQTGPQHHTRFSTVVTSPAGAPTELLDEDGALTWRARATFWGEQAPGPIPLAFPGQYRDDETGLHYNLYRYYDPQTARYLSQDPLGLAAGPNPVGYVDQPFLEADPLGLTGTCGKKQGPQPPQSPGGGDDAGKLGASSKKPDGLEEFRDENGTIDLGKMDEETYEKFAKKWGDLLSPGENKSWFWSGGRVKDSVLDEDGTVIQDSQYLGSIEKLAREQAQGKGGSTLEMMLEKHQVVMPEFIKGDPRTTAMWNDPSEALARNARGEVHVALPNSPSRPEGLPYSEYGREGVGNEVARRRPDNAFDMTEFPALRDNPRISKITIHDVHNPEDKDGVELWNAADERDLTNPKWNKYKGYEQ